MNKKPTVSIIVPVYNAETYINQCVESLLGQTCQNIEIVLVDDGSSDASGSICDTYASKDSRIKTIHQENQGLVKTWIRGTRESTGKYLCYVDSDDYIEAEMIETLLVETTENPKEMICSNIICDFPDRQVEEKNQLAPGVYEGAVLNEIQYKRLLGNDERAILFSRCTKLIARGLIEENIRYSEPSLRMGEDLNIMLPAMIDSERIVVLDKAFYHYRQYGTSMVHAYNEKLYDEVKRLTDILRRVLVEKKVPDACRYADKEFVILLLLVVKNELRGNPGYLDELQRIFTEKENRRMLKSTSVQIREKSKKLIYFGMKHPCKMYWMGLKKLMQIKGTF